MEFAKYLPCLGADGPSSAVHAVSVLFHLPFAGAWEGRLSLPYANKDTGVRVDSTFGEYLAYEILDQSHMTYEQRLERYPDLEFATITMSVTQANAEIRFHGDDDRIFSLRFQHPHQPLREGENALMEGYVPRPPLWLNRTTVVPFKILSVCADLVRAAPARSAKPSSTGGSSNEGNPQPRTPNENAPDPPRSEALCEGEAGGKTDHIPPELLPISENREAGKVPQPLCAPVDRLRRAQSSARLKSHEDQAA